MSAGNDIANEAKKLLGKPFKYGASGPDAFDSSGLVVYVFKKVTSIELPRGEKHLIMMGKKIARNAIKPGDLVFPHAGHVGISIGGDEYIHAPNFGDMVKIATLTKFLTARRIL